MLNAFKRLLGRYHRSAARPIVEAVERSAASRPPVMDHADVLEAIRTHTWLAKEAAQHAFLAAGTGALDRRNDPKRLSRAYGQVYSQYGEDGYIAEIFARVGTRNRTFLEIGIEDGTQNTTRLLLEQGWSGVWVEGNPAHADAAARIFRQFIDGGSLTVVNALAQPDNIDEVLDRHDAPDEFDYISVDIDRNTSHLWRALRRRSRVACIEYNASIPPSAALEVPFDPEAAWDGTNFFGAGLKTLELIGAAKGMSLVGCDYQGVNAYFVADGEARDLFHSPFTAENHHEPPRYSLIERLGHPPSRIARRWSTSSEPRER